MEEILEKIQVTCEMEVTLKMIGGKCKPLILDRLIRRMVYAEVPPRVEYSITEKGRSLEQILYLMCEWGETHMDERFELTNPQCTEE